MRYSVSGLKPRAVVALDPGGTTGVACWDKERDKWERFQVNTSTAYGVKELLVSITAVAQKFEPFLAKPVIDVVYERFEFRHEERFRDKIDYTAAEIIGALKQWALDRPYIELFHQSASTAKAFWQDDKLKKLALWVPGMRHAMDATRHAMYHRVFTLNDKDILERLR